MSPLYDYIISEYTFERIIDYNDDYKNTTYEEFLNFNKECINLLSHNEKEWLTTLCNKINNNQICLVDEESCVEWEAYCFYYNKNKQLCLIHPR